MLKRRLADGGTDLERDACWGEDVRSWIQAATADIMFLLVLQTDPSCSDLWLSCVSIPSLP